MRFHDTNNHCHVHGDVNCNNDGDNDGVTLGITDRCSYIDPNRTHGGTQRGTLCVTSGVSNICTNTLTFGITHISANIWLQRCR